jgi:hypothetical protein
VIITLPDIPTFILMVREVSQGSRECGKVLERLLRIPGVMLSQIGISPLVLPPPIPLCSIPVNQGYGEPFFGILLRFLCGIHTAYTPTLLSDLQVESSHVLFIAVQGESP